MKSKLKKISKGKNQKSKIMYFAFEGFDTPNGTNHLALKIIETFLDSNYEVLLMTSHSTGINEDIPSSLRYRDGFKYEIVNRKNVSKRNFVARYIDGLTYALKAFRRWRKVKDLDAVILQSTPTVFFSAILLKFFCHAPIVFNSYDIFPNGPYMMGAMKNKIVYKILSGMQKIVYRCCTCIVVISEDMKDSFVRMGISGRKLAVIPNWYDDSQIHCVEKENNRFINKYNIDTGKFIVQYAGNFGFTFNYRIILKLAQKLKKEQDIVFHMVGTGGFENDFKEQAQKSGLTNIMFFPWQPLEQMSDVYSAASIEIIPLSKGVIYNSYPSKTSLLMACHRSFICINEKDAKFTSFVREKGIGFSFDYDELELVALKIIELRDNQELLGRADNAAYLVGSSDFSSSSNSIKYVKLVNELL